MALFKKKKKRYSVGTLWPSAMAAGITPESIYEMNDKEMLSSLSGDIVIWGHAQHSLGLLWSGTCVQSWDKLLSLTPTAADTSPPHGRHEESPFTLPPLLQQKSNLAKSTSKAKERVHSHISVTQQQLAVSHTCWVSGDMGPFSCLTRFLNWGHQMPSGSLVLWPILSEW